MVFKQQRKAGFYGTQLNRFWDPAKVENKFVADLLETKGTDDTILDRRVKHVLRAIRFRRVIQPYLDIIKPITTPLDVFWETITEFWRPSEEASTGLTVTTVHYGGANFPGPTAGPFVGSVAGIDPVAAVPVFEDAGIKTGEITAYRAWILYKDGLLHSCYESEFAWAPGIPVEGDPTEPWEGVHAFKTREKVLEYVGKSPGYVFGTVHLYGDVYEHTEGYRASHAMIASIEDASLEDGEPTYDAPALRKKYKLDQPKDLPSDE